jgi:hypothetical protein
MMPSAPETTPATGMMDRMGFGEAYQPPSLDAMIPDKRVRAAAVFATGVAAVRLLTV